MYTPPPSTSEGPGRRGDSLVLGEDSPIGSPVVIIDENGNAVDENGNPAGPLKFTCSWIELYEKVDGKWKVKGNVSTFHPERK